jgi:hypothetical protein
VCVVRQKAGRRCGNSTGCGAGRQLYGVRHGETAPWGRGSSACMAGEAALQLNAWWMQPPSTEQVTGGLLEDIGVKHGMAGRDLQAGRSGWRCVGTTRGAAERVGTTRGAAERVGIARGAAERVGMARCVAGSNGKFRQLGDVFLLRARTWKNFGHEPPLYSKFSAGGPHKQPPAQMLLC